MEAHAGQSECGCNACYSDPSGRSDQCENGAYWHALADRLLAALAPFAEAAEHLHPSTAEDGVTLDGIKVSAWREAWRAHRSAR